jgi:hypothetical protein
MECSVCFHKWCWTCGLQLYTKLHTWMVPLCQIMNISFLNSSIPLFLRPLLGVVAYLMLTPVLLFLVPFFTIYYYFITSKLNKYKHLMCRQRKCKVISFLIIWLPFWTLFTALDLILTSLLFVLLIGVFYFIGLLVIFRMFYWWHTNKRLDKLTHE